MNQITGQKNIFILNTRKNWLDNLKIVMCFSMMVFTETIKQMNLGLH